MALTIARETPDQAEVHALLEQADRRSAGLYPEESRHGLDVAALLAQRVHFFVARLDGRAVGCGGYAPEGDGTAELKRIFVATEARGLGIGRALLAALEAEARREGIRLLRLETGVKSTEALGLYRRFGYRETGPFGAYGPDPLSVFMEKALPDE
ncbi:GNAT family N-acetyltransferase [Inquilinus limosus]|uniref:GNAT family N-acetyltransferase n=1 Tax=Inquilinus limosus TaxID=171674 RepID=UPI0004222F5D|nr:GNAT family N-acetyltransferase [Inquilinus limosus]